MAGMSREQSPSDSGPHSWRHGSLASTLIRPIDLLRPADPSSSASLENRAVVADLRRVRRSYRTLDLLVAFAALAPALVAANFTRFPDDWTHFLALRLTVKNVILLGIFGLGWVGSFGVFGLYRRRILHGRKQEMSRIFAACTLGTIGVLLFPTFTHKAAPFPYLGVLLFWVVVTAATVTMRMGTQLFHYASRQRVIRRVVIIGTGPRAVELARQLRADTQTRYDILGFVDTREASTRGASDPCGLGYLEDFEQTLMHTVVDEVLVALPVKSHYAEIEKAIRACESAGVQSKYLADVFAPSLARPRLETSGNLPVVAMRVVEDDYRLKVKRAFDVVCVACALPLLLPVFACIAVAIKATSPGPVLFAHDRYGHKKRRFRMYKFRTMLQNAESMMPSLEEQNEATGPVFKIQKDPRVTPFGHFLRKTSLDELPQLFNVLYGDMSLVGPRPLSVRDVARFEHAATMRRFSVRPGLTGLWQISGRSNLPFKRWVELDLAYIDRWSLMLDLKILLRTIPAVIGGAGAL